MKLSLTEQETIILFNEKERRAEVYTHNGSLQNQLRQLCTDRPAQAQLISETEHGGITVTLPKKWVKIVPARELSEAQKQVLAEMNRRNRERKEA